MNSIQAVSAVLLMMAATLSSGLVGCKDDDHSLPMIVDDTDNPDPEEPGDKKAPPRPASENTTFVRSATLAILGHRPLSEQETQAAAEFIHQVDKLRAQDQPSGREVWAKGLMQTKAFRNRFQDIVMDALHIPRTGVQQLSACYGQQLLSEETEDLAQFVRDNPSDVSFGEEFSFLDLLRSSLILDDLTPIYQAHPFAMLSKPNACGNVDPIEQELTTRQEVGHVFDSTYLNRNQVCLGCHNSSFSVTYSSDPEENRHFATEALLEEAVFGSSFGTKEAQVHAVFRTSGFLRDDLMTAGFAFCEDREDNFVAGFPVCNDQQQPACDDGATPKCSKDGWSVSCDGVGPGEDPTCVLLEIPDDTSTPWGASRACGIFSNVVESDPAQVEAKLASISGTTATTRDLATALSEGFSTLRADGLQLQDNRTPEDPNAALAYMVSMKISETIWTEIMGSSLTISTRFPRSQATADMLQKLTNQFIASGYSLQQLILEILMSPYFITEDPQENSEQAYNYPPIFNVFAREALDPAERNNSAGDGVHPLSARTLLSATYAALNWPVPENQAFPEEFEAGDFLREEGSAEAGFLRSIGVFLSLSEKGFRGLDVSARLAWEERFGACQKPNRVGFDALDAIFEKANEQETSLEAIVLAMKDRLIAEATLTPPERSAIEALLGTTLYSAFNSEEHEPSLRMWCGALLASPQHLLGGLPAIGGTPSELGPSQEEVCQDLREIVFPGYEITCPSTGMNVTPVEDDKPNASR